MKIGTHTRLVITWRMVSLVFLNSTYKSFNWPKTIWWSSVVGVVPWLVSGDAWSFGMGGVVSPPHLPNTRGILWFSHARIPRPLKMGRVSPSRKISRGFGRFQRWPPGIFKKNLGGGSRSEELESQSISSTKWDALETILVSSVFCVVLFLVLKFVVGFGLVI